MNRLPDAISRLTGINWSELGRNRGSVMLVCPRCELKFRHYLSTGWIQCKCGYRVGMTSEDNGFQLYPTEGRDEG